MSFDKSFLKSHTDLPECSSLRQLQGSDDEALLSAIYKLRLHVWQSTGTRIALPKDATELRDYEDSFGTHFAIIHEETPIAATRINIYQKFSTMHGSEYFDSEKGLPQEPVGAIGRLVVEPKFQFKGLGKFLDSQCIEFAIRNGAKSILCDVPSYRISPLQRMGFRVIQTPQKGVVLPDIDWTILCLDV